MEPYTRSTQNVELEWFTSVAGTIKRKRAVFVCLQKYASALSGLSGLMYCERIQTQLNPEGVQETATTVDRDRFTRWLNEGGDDELTFLSALHVHYFRPSVAVVDPDNEDGARQQFYQDPVFLGGLGREWYPHLNHVIGRSGEVIGREEDTRSYPVPHQYPFELPPSLSPTAEDDSDGWTVCRCDLDTSTRIGEQHEECYITQKFPDDDE